jgi:rod shape-determining protein MreD
MYWKILFNGLLILLLFAIQVAFIPVLPAWLSSLDLALVILIFILVFGNFTLAMFWALALGFLYDIFSFSIFGLHLFIIVLSITAANFLLKNFFTNRSLYSLGVLVGLTTFFHYILILAGGYLDGLIKGQTSASLLEYYFSGMFKQLVLNLMAAIILFYFLNYFGGRFKPVFLSKRLNRF